jgi:hypothetical protein
VCDFVVGRKMLIVVVVFLVGFRSLHFFFLLLIFCRHRFSWGDFPSFGFFVTHTCFWRVGGWVLFIKTVEGERGPRRLEATRCEEEEEEVEEEGGGNSDGEVGRNSDGEVGRNSDGEVGGDGEWLSSITHHLIILYLILSIESNCRTKRQHLPAVCRLHRVLP